MIRLLRARDRWLMSVLAVLLWGAIAPANAAQKKNPSPHELRIVAVGDIMLGGDSELEQTAGGYDHPFVQVGDMLRSADIAFGNLEGPLTQRGSAVWFKNYTFRSPPERVAPALARTGFDFLSLANNHVLDYGDEGLYDTRQGLQRAGIHYTGAGENLADARTPAFFDVKNGPPTIDSGTTTINR
ncbi:MAG: CapA family protein [Gammaproteobacteria bacterium]|nr:CapA family protein [Gammaproteobacteria bacterium]